MIFFSNRQKSQGRLEEEVALLRKSHLLDAIWYRETYPDLRDSPVDVARHYLEHGAREGRNPHLLFDTKWYLSHTSGLGAGENPLVHFLTRSTFVGAHPHPLIDVDFYISNIPGFEQSRLDPLTHYLTIGWRQGLRPNKFFDPRWYLDQYPDVEKAGLEPLTHYLLEGWRHHRPNPRIDPASYRERYGLSGDANPLLDLVLLGKWRLEEEGSLKRRKAGQTQDDVAAVQSESDDRYRRAGISSSAPQQETRFHRDARFWRKSQTDPSEERSRAVRPAHSAGKKLSGAIGKILPRPRKPRTVTNADIQEIRISGLFDEDYYRSSNPDLRQEPDLAKHFLAVGAWEGKQPNRMFDSNYYLEQNPDVLEANINPLIHFIRFGLKEGRRPHPCFDVEFYLKVNPDLVAAGVNPLVHYLEFGEKEGRSPAELSYKDWCTIYDQLNDGDRSKIASRIEQLSYQPLISIILEADSFFENAFRTTLESLTTQLYSKWELLVASPPQVGRQIRSFFEAQVRDGSRIKVIDNNRPSRRSVPLSAMLKSVEGEFFCIIDVTGQLSEHALYMIVEELNRYPKSEIIYSDEDRIDKNGHRIEPHFKSDWNPDLFYSQNYFGRLTACRVQAAYEVGGLGSYITGAEEYDLFLKILEKGGCNFVRHIPFVLYHEVALYDAFPLAEKTSSLPTNAARHALSEHFDRIGKPDVRVVAGVREDLHRVVWPVPGTPPLVSFVIPTAGSKLSVLRECLSGVLQRTQYDNFEVILLYNTSPPEETLLYFDALSADPRVKIIKSSGPFNFSYLCNVGVSHSRGDIVALLNDDTQVIDSGWLSEMVGHSIRAEVGAVGAMLYYADDTIQHAGMTVGINGLAEHRYRFSQRGILGYRARASVTQDLSAVTAACLLVRREVYDEVGGMDENIAVDFNDLDFCFKIRERGYLIVWTPFAQLYHLERTSAPRDTSPGQRERFNSELDYVKKKWAAFLSKGDPYFNPNLRLDKSGYEFGAKPRIDRPWVGL